MQYSGKLSFTNLRRLDFTFFDLYSCTIACATFQKFEEKTFADGRKPAKFTKVFSFESFQLCSTHIAPVSHSPKFVMYQIKNLLLMFVVDVSEDNA